MNFQNRFHYRSAKSLKCEASNNLLALAAPVVAHKKSSPAFKWQEIAEDNIRGRRLSREWKRRKYRALGG